MLLEISLVVLLALLNGFFALSEMALMVARKSRLKHLAVTSRRAKVALGLAQRPGIFLATVQVLSRCCRSARVSALGARSAGAWSRAPCARPAVDRSVQPAARRLLSVSFMTFFFSCCSASSCPSALARRSRAVRDRDGAADGLL